MKCTETNLYVIQKDNLLFWKVEFFMHQSPLPVSQKVNFGHLAYVLLLSMCHDIKSHVQLLLLHCHLLSLQSNPALPC